MGTRINVLLDHKLADYSDREAVLHRLKYSVAAALRVQDYWRSARSADRWPRSHDEVKVWRPDPVLSVRPEIHCYTGPGALFLRIAKHAAWIWTGGRWRGFLTIAPLRRVHLAAFREIAVALGSTCMALYPDPFDVDDLSYGGRPQSECIQLMQQKYGPPQANMDVIESSVAAAAEVTVPMVWFLEDFRSATGGS